ncbi:hypothetical protein [Aestuariibius sp. HNIBRBA575]|uniref:hypothetical protein n=1 Tax=Aestuariibius sp. HNIBRBA575 TaxID=3233343 RepID=UPI0034A222EA
MKLRAAIFGLMATMPNILWAGCNYDLVTVSTWEITPIDDRTNLLRTHLGWQGDGIVRMIDGSVEFKDVLGGRIASFALNRDEFHIPGRIIVQEGRWGPHTFERLLDMNFDDVVTSVCVRGIVHDDGRVEQF